jgi:hypothetical protein
VPPSDARAGVAFAGSATATAGQVGAGIASLLGIGGAAYKIGENLEIPKLITRAGEAVRVLPSAIKHVQEFAQRSQTFTTPLNMKLFGESFIRAVGTAMDIGLKFGEKMYVGGWELIFQASRTGGPSVLIHAVPGQ